MDSPCGIRCEDDNHDVQLSSPTTKLTLEGNKQWYINVEKEEWKLDTFVDIHETATITRALVMCGSEDKVHVIAGHMQARGLVVHTLLESQNAEDQARLKNGFRNGSSMILVTTDHFACTIKKPPITLIIHYDIPSPEEYMARVGRIRRFGAGYVSILLVTSEDREALQDIEGSCSTRIEEMPLNIADLI